jgi:streptomycin 6-kinase
MRFPLPASLGWLRSRASGAAWLDRLPHVLNRACDRWNLQLDGEPYPGGVAGLVLPVRRDGQPCVLKLQWPHPECEQEADALRVWNGHGAVRLLEHDPDDHALLLERCTPGTFLAGSGHPDPMAEMADLLPKLWVPANGPFRTLTEEAAGWRANLPEAWARAGKPCEWELVDAALGFIDALAPTQGEPVLVHQDLHGHNVLSAGEGRWLAIDPKPLVGERAFSLAPVVRSDEFGTGETAVRGRLDRLTSALGVGRERALGWTVAQTMAWAFEGTESFPNHFRIVRWLLGG